MKIALALDQSISNTGYCRGGVDGSSLFVDSFAVNPKFSGDVGAQLVDFENKLSPRLHDVDLIFYERPIRPHGMVANINVLLPLYALAGHIDYMANKRGIPCFEVDNGSHKKLIYGKGGSKPLNQAELAACWGFKCSNGDEADACGVFLKSIEAIFPEFFPNFTAIKSAAPLVPFIDKPKKKRQKKK